jgi:hypothetical protein
VECKTKVQARKINLTVVNIHSAGAEHILEKTNEYCSLATPTLCGCEERRELAKNQYISLIKSIN